MISTGVILALVTAVLTYGCVPPTGAADKQAIQSLISEFNAAVKVNDFDRLTALFTKDGDYADDSAPPRTAAVAIRQLAPKRLPWDERTALTMKIESISFSSPDKAIVEAFQSDYAPTVGISRKWSCHFVVVRTGRTWRIASYRESAVAERPK